MSFILSRKGNYVAALSTALVGKHCSKLGNELLSKQVAATRCSVTANLELQRDTKNHKLPPISL